MSSLYKFTDPQLIHPPLYSVLTEHYDQERLMSIALGIDVHYGFAFCNPYRDDKNPGCGVYWSEGGVLRLADQASDWHGYSAVDVVRRVLQYDTQSAILHLMHEYDEYAYTKQVKAVTRVPFNFYLKCYYREWNKTDWYYWNPYGIELIQLHNDYVWPLIGIVKNSKKDPKTLEKLKMSVLAYSIPLTTGEKVYIPRSKIFFQGGESGVIIPEDHGAMDYMTIAGSYKDYRVLRNHGLVGGYLSNETYLPRNWDFTNGLKYLILALDNDSTGIRAASRFAKECPIPVYAYYVPFPFNDVAQFRKFAGEATLNNHINAFADEQQLDLYYRPEPDLRGSGLYRVESAYSDQAVRA